MTMTSKVEDIWRTFEMEMEWAQRAHDRGDQFRYELAVRAATRKRDSALAELGARPANGNGRGYKPELKILCGSHKAFVDPCYGPHPMHAGPLGPDARTDEDPTMVELPVVRTGSKEVA
jgi:hypothetical protein